MALVGGVAGGGLAALVVIIILILCISVVVIQKRKRTKYNAAGRFTTISYLCVLSLYSIAIIMYVAYYYVCIRESFLSRKLPAILQEFYCEFHTVIEFSKCVAWLKHLP